MGIYILCPARAASVRALISAPSVLLRRWYIGMGMSYAFFFGIRSCNKNSLRDNFSKGHASSCGHLCSSHRPTRAH